MNFILQPWQLLVLILAGWINRQQQEIIQGALANLGHKISGTTVGDILERAWDRTGSGAQAAIDLEGVQCRERPGGLLRYYREAA